MAVISGVMCGWWVSAKLLVLDKPPLIKKTKMHIQQQVKKSWIPFLQKTYQQLESRKNTSKNLLVRRQLHDLELWMKQEYALSDTERTTTAIRKEQVFLTKDGKKMVRKGASFWRNRQDRKNSWKNILTNILKRNNENERSVVKRVEEKITAKIDLKVNERIIKKNIKPQNIKNTLIWDDWYTLANGRVNITTLKDTWVWWVNDYRVSEWIIGKIVLNARLNKTATEWSYKMRSDGKRSHKRFADSGFYNYQQLVDWFWERGIVFQNIKRATFTENVGQGYFTCKTGDCTAAALTSLRHTFDYFIHEKGTLHDAHYRTIVKKEFKIVWFGIAIDEKNHVLYSTMHYGTEILK